MVRRRWDEVLGTLERRRVTWVLVKQSAQVASLDNGVLKLAFDGAPLAARFAAGNHAENVALAVRETLGLHVRVEGTVGPAGSFTPASAPRSTATATVAPSRDADHSPPTEVIPTQPATSTIPQPPASDAPPWDDEPPPDDEPSHGPAGRASAAATSVQRPSITPAAGPASKPTTASAERTSSSKAPSGNAPSAQQQSGGAAPREDDEEVSDDDAAAPDAGLSGADMVAKMLGGKVIES